MMNDREIIRQKVQSLREILGEQRDINLDELIAFIDSMPEKTEEIPPKFPLISPKDSNIGENGKDCKEIENDDLEKAARKWEDKVYLEKGWQDEYGTPHAPFSEIGNAFIAGAELQKQKMKETLQTEYEKGRFDSMQDFLEKAEEFLYEQFNIHPHDCHVVQYVSDTPLEDIDDFVEQFKNYMQDEN